MTQENFNYLNEQVKRTGFANLENELREKMESGEPSFQLKYQQVFDNEKVDAALNFRKSAQSDTYYFNSYEAVQKEENSNRPETKQTFYVGKDNTYSFDEARNLLSRRFVNKDLVNSTGEAYNAWTKLNFKETDVNGNYKFLQFGEKWGFDLEKALAKYPMIKELGNEAEKAQLMEALKKGNRPEVTLTRDGKEAKGYVLANAYSRSVMVTDENGQKIRFAQKEKTEQSENQGQDNSQKNKNQQDNNQKAGAKNNNKRNRRQGMRA